MTTKAPSAVEHDEGYLYSKPKTDGPYISDDDCIAFAKQYGVHLTAKLQADNDALRGRVKGLEASLEYWYDRASRDKRLINIIKRKSSIHPSEIDEISKSLTDHLPPHPLLEQSS